MTDEQEKSKGFKVEDRRRFSPEGELKPEYRDESGAEQTGAQSSQGSSKAEGGERPQGLRFARGVGEADFSSLIVGLSTQALVYLGEIPDPSTNLISRDLAAASYLIDLLGVLEQKTRGNLTQDEERLLATILYDLRMKYVELTHAGIGGKVQ